MTDQLNILFEEWKKQYKKNNEDPKDFAKDGIINEEKFNNTSLKLLFIAKETNRGHGDFRSWWQGKEDDGKVKGQFSKRIFEWAYSIFHNFPGLELIPNDQSNRISTLSKVAFMNLKKTPGVNKASPKEIKKTVINFKLYILNEIEIIGPNIIIGGISDSTLWDDIFSSLDVKTTKINGRKVMRTKKIRIVDFYHPSCRIPRVKTYRILRDIISSDNFKNM